MYKPGDRERQGEERERESESEVQTNKQIQMDRYVTSHMHVAVCQQFALFLNPS